MRPPNRRWPLSIPRGGTLQRSGDYDGDGTSDILWRSCADGTNQIWRSANVATPQAVTTVNDFFWAIINPDVRDLSGMGCWDY